MKPSFSFRAVQPCSSTCGKVWANANFQHCDKVSASRLCLVLSYLYTDDSFIIVGHVQIYLSVSGFSCIVILQVSNSLSEKPDICNTTQFNNLMSIVWPEVHLLWSFFQYLSCHPLLSS